MAKLVRDRIPENIKLDGKEAIFHVADDNEYWDGLVLKLIEEADEVREAGSEEKLTEELADVLEVICAICSYKGIEMDKLETLRKEKERKKGGFTKRYILEGTR